MVAAVPLSFDSRQIPRQATPTRLLININDIATSAVVVAAQSDLLVLYGSQSESVLYLETKKTPSTNLSFNPSIPETVSGVTTNVMNPSRDIIAAGRWVLGLREDWDEDGALPINPAVFDRMADIITRFFFLTKYAPSLPEPEITPISDGSLDVHWRLPDRLLALNFPPDVSKRPSFYARADDHSSFQGDLGPGFEKNLATWLIQ